MSRQEYRTWLGATDITSGVTLDFWYKQMNAIYFAYISMKTECKYSLFDKLDFVLKMKNK